jgi:hypothetical protein
MNGANMESPALSIGEQFLMAFKEGEKVGLERRGLEVARLMAALAAAEAECAEWRKSARAFGPTTALVTERANDATRARLELPKIGEVRDEA